MPWITGSEGYVMAKLSEIVIKLDEESKKVMQAFTKALNRYSDLIEKPSKDPSRDIDPDFLKEWDQR